MHKKLYIVEELLSYIFFVSKDMGS
ncbi:uncharacterized protein METZ01_LOCUS83942 [marine metagenome]|uniref:Uncharacterized protein n=1 Tax=marine metagenome TaxID=408172 RepID=A0A381UTY4_9ZZZZ